MSLRRSRQLTKSVGTSIRAKWTGLRMTFVALENSSQNLLAQPRTTQKSSKRRKPRSTACAANSIAPNANAVAYKNTSRSSKQTLKPSPSRLTNQNRPGNVTMRRNRNSRKSWINSAPCSRPRQAKRPSDLKWRGARRQSWSASAPKFPNSSETSPMLARPRWRHRTNSRWTLTLPAASTSLCSRHIARCWNGNERHHRNSRRSRKICLQQRRSKDPSNLIYNPCVHARMTQIRNSPKLRGQRRLVILA